MKNIFSLLLILGLFISIPACVDQEFDEPPAGGSDGALPATMTIADLKSIHSAGNFEEITGDEVIEGIVISSDAAGNFFRQLVIQDETAGILLLIDQTDLDNLYPPGRKISVKCQGLWLGDYAGLTQLGSTPFDDGGGLSLGRIPDVLLDDILVKQSFGNEVIPKDYSLASLNKDDLTTLVKFSDVQWVSSELGQTYAVVGGGSGQNRHVADCSLNQIIVRNSDFATFANEPLPNGNGSITGVLSFFGSDFQLVIRNLLDVDMEGERCGAGGGDQISVQALKDAFGGGATTAPDGFIEGVVISDYTNGNVTGRNLYIQDGEAGIVVRFASNHTFELGELLQVNVSGLELSEFSGLLQVNNVPNGFAVAQGPTTLPDPRISTISEITSNLNSWESTLVKIEKATLSGSSIFDGNVTVTDASGSMVMFTRGQASFSGDALPTGEVTITAILSEFNEAQLILKSRADVEGGGTGGETVETIDQNFSGESNNVNISAAGWSNIAVKGTRLWQGKEFDSNFYAQATSFNDASVEMETWLITPKIDLSKPKTLEFESAQAFYNHDGLSVWVSIDFDGENVTAATWEALSPTLAGSTSPDHEWIGSGLVDLSAFTGEIHIGFKYVGSDSGGQTTSYRLDNVMVQDK